MHCSDTVFLEMKMEQLDSGDRRRISNQFSQILYIGHFECGYTIFKKAEDERRDFSFVLITLGQKFLPPSGPRPFGRQTCGSVFTGRRVDSR